MWITILLAVLLCLSIGYSIYQKRKTYRLIDRLLDSVLNREMIAASDVEEGEYSALVSKIKQIQEVLDNHVNSAEQEKEQVKSLVSNMSHQLKTPLANISLYAEILSKEEITSERKTLFSEKMQRQIDKLSWIVESLSKMVKLEQNIDGFEGKAIGIKQTILDAVDTLYEKLEKKEINFTLEPFEDRLLYHNRKWTAEVFVNLLENAVKYTDRGGTISICVKSYDLYTEIQIADNGRGIRQEEMTDIFKRFYRSPEVENMEGSGIGLYLSNLILEKEKGYFSKDEIYETKNWFIITYEAGKLIYNKKMKKAFYMPKDVAMRGDMIYPDDLWGEYGEKLVAVYTPEELLAMRDKMKKEGVVLTKKVEQLFRQVEAEKNPVMILYVFK